MFCLLTLPWTSETHLYSLCSWALPVPSAVETPEADPGPNLPRILLHLGRCRTRCVCVCWSGLRSGIVVNTLASGVAAKSGCGDSWYNHMAISSVRNCYVLQSSRWRGGFLTAAACSAAASQQAHLS